MKCNRQFTYGYLPQTKSQYSFRDRNCRIVKCVVCDGTITGRFVDLSSLKYVFTQSQSGYSEFLFVQIPNVVLLLYHLLYIVKPINLISKNQFVRAAILYYLIFFYYCNLQFYKSFATRKQNSALQVIFPNSTPCCMILRYFHSSSFQKQLPYFQ